MSLVSSFVALLQPLAVTMTCPSFENFKILVSGWVFAARRTVTQMIIAAGAVGQKHHATLHRVFAAARWSRDQLGLVVFDMIEPWLGEVVFLASDDTLARKRGLKMFGTGMHYDPLLSSRGNVWGLQLFMDVAAVEVDGVVAEVQFVGHLRLYKTVGQQGESLNSLGLRIPSGVLSARDWVFRTMRESVGAIAQAPLRTSTMVW